MTSTKPFCCSRNRGFAHRSVARRRNVPPRSFRGKLAAYLELTAGDGALDKFNDFMRATATDNGLTGQSLHFTILDLWWNGVRSLLVAGNAATGGHRAEYRSRVGIAGPPDERGCQDNLSPRYLPCRRCEGFALAAAAPAMRSVPAAAAGFT